MTRTAIYSLQDNALTEQPAMEKPHEILFYSESVYTNEPSFDQDGYDKAIQEYNDHIKSLRTIPAHESCRSLWKEGQMVVEGKDYEVREAEVSIYAEIGTKMKAIFKDGLPANGYEHEQKAAAKYLQPDTIYELSDSFVGDWHTDFRLKEFPGISFNSVHFVYPDPVAFPLPVKGMTTNDWMKVGDEPVKSEQGEDDLWAEAIHYLINNPSLSYNTKISDLKQSFIITKR